MVKVQVKVQDRKSPPVEFELNLQEEILPQVESLCEILGIGDDEKHKYTLRYEKNALSDLTVSGFPTIPANGLMTLGLKPKYESMIILQKLVELQDDPNQLKNTFFFLRKNLQDLEFAAAFVGQNGIMLLVNVMMNISGNALAYCLQAIEEAMNYKIGWDGIEEKHIQKIFSLIRWDESGLNKTNVVTCAIRIGVLLAESPKQNGYEIIRGAVLKNAEETNEPPYSGIIQCIGSTCDLNMQTDALQLVNGIYKTAPSAALKKAFLQELSALGIQKVLQRQLNTENTMWKAQLCIYQHNIIEQYNMLRLIPYDKTNPEHEAVLMKLWTAVFPDQELKKRVCDQWKEMGFQGQDPATDFRGMGMLGLDNLLYIAENHPVIFRRIVKEQSSRDDNDYPVAVTGISITQLLHSIFWNEKGPSDTVHHILFDHDFAFEEMYCIIFQLLDRTWDEMNAAYMDFPNVLNAVKEKVSVVLKSSDTLSSFQNGCNKGTPVEAFLKKGKEAEESQVEIVIPEFDVDQRWKNEIEEFVQKEVDVLVNEQKRQALKDGAVFKELNRKGKHQNPAYIQMQCANDEKEILWERIPDLTAAVETLNNSIALDDLAAVLTGQNNPLLAKLKKADDDILKNGFSLQLQDGTSFDLIAQNRDDFVNWTDGIRLLLGLEMETIETERAIESLISSGVCVRLMNLEGLKIPESPLEVPAPPSNFNFFLRDNKEIEIQNQPRAQ